MGITRRMKIESEGLTLPRACGYWSMMVIFAMGDVLLVLGSDGGLGAVVWYVIWTHVKLTILV